VEVRLDDSLAVRFGKRYLAVTQCQPRPKAPSPKAYPKRKSTTPRAKSQWMKNLRLTSPEKTALDAIAPLFRSAAQNQFGRPDKNGPTIFALDLSEDRCLGESPKQMGSEKPKPPKRAALGPV
jgi:hypothetical protein